MRKTLYLSVNICLGSTLRSEHKLDKIAILIFSDSFRYASYGGVQNADAVFF